MSGVVESRGEGAVAAVFRFAYALYLIAHHDTVPTALVRRLRKPVEFRAAALETLVVAAFALAGYKIRMGEDRKGKGPEGEFAATSAKTGKTFNVEAKRKNGWKASIDVGSEAFSTELRLWIQRKVYAAARKKLQNPIYWLELSIAAALDRPEVESIHGMVREALRDAESSILIDGQVPSPAYVFITNHSFFAADDATDAAFFMLEGFHLKMPVKGDRVEVEQALVQRDRDRDAVWILECLQKVQMVPHQFDGTPDDLIDQNKTPIKRLQVGERLEVTLPDHRPVTGLVMDVVSIGAEATVILLNEETGKQEMVTLPLTAEEQRAAAALGDAVFGNPNAVRKVPDDDPLAIYDFFMEVYASTPREKLLEFLEKHAQFDEFKSLSTDDLRTRVCREWAKSAIADHEARTALNNAAAAGQTS
jgi:hypothetical protein